MKRFVAFIACVIVISTTITAQSTRYLIGNFYVLQSGDNPFKMDGKHRYSEKNDIFFFTNTTLNYTIELNHFTHRNPEILDLPISELETLDEVIPAEDLLKFENADNAYKWMLDIARACSKELYHYGEIRTKLYVIDTNDYYKSDPALDAPDRMKVVEVRVDYQDIPDYILNPDMER